MTVIGERPVQGRWFLFETLVDYINDKYKLTNTINMIQTITMKKMVRKLYSIMTSEGNTVLLGEGRGTVTLYRHCYKSSGKEKNFYLLATPML